MNNLNTADIEQLFNLFDSLLTCVGLSALIIGFFAGWHFRADYSFKQWLKRGVYCDDCAPVVFPKFQDEKK